MSYSVGVYEDDDLTSHLSRRVLRMLGAGPTADRVSVWTRAEDGWRSSLVEQLLEHALPGATATAMVRTGWRRPERVEVDPLAAFLSGTEPSGSVHHPFVLLLDHGGHAVSMLTDVDGDSLDVVVAADPAHAIARRVGAAAWRHLAGAP